MSEHIIDEGIPSRRSHRPAWGTIFAGTLALGTALAVAIALAGVRIPIRSAAPGILIALGALIVAVGLVVVVRGRPTR
ncbi:MAG: hypothetical protein Q4G67_05365 [Actinomycetia bacterium]|nr:hypothetical protein [Actinomycetes bacterium]